MKKFLLYFSSIATAIVVLLAFVGVGMAGVPVLMMALSVCIPFWLLLVLPVYMLSGCGRWWPFWLTVVMCYLALAAVYLWWQWEPMAYGLTIGSKVLIEEGVPTAAYYEDLWYTVAGFGVLVALTAPLSWWMLHRGDADRPADSAKKGSDVQSGDPRA